MFLMTNNKVHIVLW